MFISDLFEAQQLKTLVIIPGGFHPFHPGHLSLYQSAQQAFPGATIVYVATDDRDERPFAFVDKQKLAQIAGVNPKNFQLVRSPFVAKEITEHFDPNNTVLIFARSEKDKDQHPMPAKLDPATGKLPLVTRGPRKGQPVSDYLQYYANNKNKLAPMSQHAYMAYLPVVQFNAGPSGVTSATQIREMWPQANDAQKTKIVTDLYPKNPQAARQILDKYLSSAVTEGQYPDDYIYLTTKSGEVLGTINGTIEDAKETAQIYANRHKRTVYAMNPNTRERMCAAEPQRPNQGVAEVSKYKCSCHPGDADPDCPVHGLEPMGVGDALDERSVSKAQFRTMAAAAHNPEFAKKVGISPKVAKEFHKADKKSNYKSLPSQVEEDEGPGMDPNVIQLKKRAKVAHPFAQSDEEALALYVNDREIKDVDELEREQNRELRMINRIEQGEDQLVKQIQRIDQELAQLKSLKSK